MPFSSEQFLQVFTEYNRGVWPSQLFLNSAALVAVCYAAAGRARSGKVVPLILAALWLWAGVVYHMTFFAAVNKAAYIFGAAFILQALLLVGAGLRGHALSFRFKADACGFAGAVIVAYSLVAYPVLGYFLGHEYPASPTFGAPCPVTIYTFGVLLWAEGRVPARLLLVPLAWSLVGGSAAFELGMAEDFGMTIAAAACAILIASRNRKLRVEGKDVGRPREHTPRPRPNSALSPPPPRPARRGSGIRARAARAGRAEGL